MSLLLGIKYSVNGVVSKSNTSVEILMAWRRINLIGQKSGKVAKTVGYLEDHPIAKLGFWIKTQVFMLDTLQYQNNS